jgi:hypothetical protein
MLTTLLTVLIAAFVLYILFFIVGKFIKGQPLTIIGVILGVIFLVFALRTFGFVSI